MKQFKRVMAMLLTLVMTLGLFAGLTLPASAANITSGFMEAPAGTYNKVTDFSSLNTTDTYIIVFGTSNALGTTQANNNRSPAASVSVSNDSVTLASGSGVQGIKLVSSGDSSYPWKLNTVSSGVGYLYAPSYNSGTSNYLRTSDTATQAGSNWSISASDIHSTGSGTRRFMKLNGTIVSCYAETGNSYTTADLYVLYTGGGGPTQYEVTITAPGNGNSIAVTAGGNAVASGDELSENTTLTLTATPATGYSFTSWNVTGSAAPSNTAANPATITLTDDTSISATFTAKTAASITLSDPDDDTNPSETYYVGDTYTLPTTAADVTGFTFMGWSTVQIPTPGSAPSSNYYNKGANVTLAASQTFYAVYAQQSGTAEVITWEPVTSAPSDWSGDYVIVNSDNTYAMTSDFRTGTSGEFLGASVTITDGKVVDPTDKMIWTVAKNGSNAQYSFQNKSTGTYAEITGTSSTNAALSSSAVWFTIASSSTTGVWKVNSVTNSARCFAWYAANTSFRTYANSSNNTGYLYKKTTSQGGASYSNYTTNPVQSSSTYSVTITQPSQGGAITTNDTLINLLEDDLVYLTAEPATGWELDEWTITGAASTTPSGNEMEVEIGTSDVTATCSFTKINYTITKNATGGTITAPATANYQDSVNFTVAPTGTNAIDSVTVKDASNQDVAFTGSNGSYTITSMPASNITITVVCSAPPTYDYTFYGPNNTSVATGNAATVTAPAGSPASITYTYPGETTPTTFTFAGWVAGQAQLTTPGAASGAVIPAGTSITLSANTTYRAVYVSGSGAGFKLSVTSSGTTYYVGPRDGNNSYLAYPTDAADAAEFVLEEDSNNAGHYFMYYLNGTDKVYIYNSSTDAGSDTGLEFSANTAPSGSGYIYWVESITNGVATYLNVNSSGSGTRYLAFNSNRFSTYGTSYAHEFTKTDGAAYLTEPGANYFAVTYYENAGADTVTNMPDNGAAQENTSYTIPATTPVRDGYRFDGWATSASGSVDYAAGSLPTSITVSAAVDLYAHWTAVPTATVTFYAADNTTTFDTATVYEGVAPTAPATDPTKDPSGIYYYTFAGWSRTAGGAAESPMTAIASGESTRAYYPVFTQTAATFTLEFSGRLKVSTEGSFQSTVLQPSLTTTQTGCSATISSLSYTYASGSASIATVSTASNALTVTGVAAGSVTLNVTATYDDGNTATAQVTVQVISGSGGANGGYTLMTQANTFTTDSGDVNNYDWSGEYIIAARPNGTAANFNTLEIMQFVWTDATTATIADSNQNRAEFDLGSATQDEFGVASATNGSVTINALHTGEGDYVSGAQTTEDGMIYDRITGLTEGGSDVTNNYVLVFERVDDINNYYTIRVKGTNYYLTNSSTALSSGNTMGGTASPDSIGSQLMWHLRWAGSADSVDGRASNTITLNGNSFTPDCILIESVEALNSSVSRAILYNQSGHMFRVYGEGAYVTNGPLAGINGGYNLYLYGKQVPFNSEIIYDDVERNTTTAKIEVPYNYHAATQSENLFLEGELTPETYPGWTVLNSGIPTWSLVGAYNPDDTTFTPTASVSAIAGTQNANFHVADWTASDIGKYYVVRINYQVRDTDGVTHDVPQQAMIVVVDADLTFNTVINEASSLDHTGSWTVPSRVGATGVDLNAYVVDNYGVRYSQRSIPDGFTLTQPSAWTCTSQRGYTYSIDSAGVVTWDPADILKDDVVVVTATAALYQNSTAKTVNAGTFTIYVNKLAYTAEVHDAGDSSNYTIPYGETAFAVTLGEFRNNDNITEASPFDTTNTYYYINSATEWTWTAVKESDGTTVPITETAAGATIDVSSLTAGTRIIVRATNVIATSNTTTGVHTVVTVHGHVFTVGEDNSLRAVDDTFVLDFDRNAVLDVMGNDRHADGATISAIGGTYASMADIGTGADAGKITFTVPGGALTSTYTFTYTLSKSGETDSTATVTVKPATAIYYEESNSFFTYTDGTKGKWTEEGTADGLTQDADASAIGFDANLASLTYSGGTIKKARVGSTTNYGTSGSSGTWPTMSFSFVGNAMELYMLRNYNSGVIRVTVDGTKKIIPTYYGATGSSENGWTYSQGDNYYGMPVFAWGDPNSTESATSHTVLVEVMYSPMYDTADPKAGYYDVFIDGVRIYNPNVGGTTYKYISFRDTVINAGTLGVPTTAAHSYAATVDPMTVSVGTVSPYNTQQLTVALTDGGATVTNTGYSVSYASADDEIATVSGTGLVTGVAEGTTTVTVTVTPNGGAAITKTVTVNVSETVYTVTYVLPNGSQQVTYATSSISLGQGVTHLTSAELAEYNAHNYSFRGWLPASAAPLADTDTMPGIMRDNGASVTLTGDATYYAVYRYGTTDADFALKTDLTNPLVNGETIVIYETEGTGDKYVLSNQDYGDSGWQLNYRSGERVVPVNGIITKTNTELYWRVVEATTGGFYLKDQSGNYLSSDGTDGHLVMTASPVAGDLSVWTATTTGVSGTASVFIHTVGTITGTVDGNTVTSPAYLQHYSGYPEFCAYVYDEAYTNKNEMQIYVQQANENYYTTTLLSNTVRYNVNYYVNGTADSSEQIAEGSDPSFPALADIYKESAGYSHDYTHLGWISAALAEDTSGRPADIYNAGDTYAVNAATNFYALFSYAGTSAGTGFTLSYTNSGTTYYLGTDNGSGGVAVSTDSANAATYGLEQIGTSEYYYLYYLSGSNKIYLTGNAGSSSSTRAVTFSAANEQPDSGYYKWYIDSNNKFVCNNGSSDGGALQINTNDKTYAKMYTTNQWGAYTRTEVTSVNTTMYATTLGAAAPITHDYQASISPTSLALTVGNTGSVSATLTDNGSAVAGATPTYTTSMASVATVASDGTVTAVANGSATITATYTVDGNDYTATCTVTVSTLATYTVTYMVNGSQYGETESVTEGSSPSFTAPSYDVSGYNAHAYEFLGWKEGSALSSDTTEAQTLYTAGNTHVIDSSKTYYAVYRYTEGGSATTAIGDLSNGGSAQYVIAANVSGTWYAMSNTFASKINGTTITTTGTSMTATEASDYAVTIAKSSSGYTISNGTDYLTYSSSTNLGTSSSAYYWSIGSGTKGSFRVESETSGRGLVYRASSTNQFGGYSTGNVTANGTEYYDVEIIPIGTSGTTYYATTLNVASAHTYVASISPSSLTLTAGNDSAVTGTLTDNGIATNAYTPAYTSSDSTVVTVDSNGYVSAEAAGTATITVTYTVDSTPYTATCAVTVNAVGTEYAASYAVQSGVTYSGNSRSGNAITLPTAVSIPSSYDAHSYSLVGWATAIGSDDTTKPTCYDPGDEVTITDDTTFYPVYSYSVGGGNATYNRITSTSDLTSGAKYLIVSEDGNRVMKSSNSSNTLANTYDTLTLDGSGTVTATSTLDGYAYTYQNSGFYGTNEKYISGTSGSNTINFPTSAAALTISFSGNNAVITSNTSVLRDNTGFRFYKAASSGTGNPVQLYKYTAGSGGGTTTYTFTLQTSSQVDNYVGTVSASPASIAIGGNTASLSASLTNRGEAVSSGDYSVSYAITSGNAATLSSSTLTSGSSAGTVTVTATFTVGGNTVATATCNVVVSDSTASVTVNYVGGSTGYVYNWGTRGEAATFLTEPTNSYYTGSYSYSTLSALSGSSTATAAAIYQSALGTAIHNMLVAKQTSTTSYDGTKTLYKYTDCVGSNTSYMSSFYSGTQITNVWDNGSTWNREHTWPNSKGLNSSDENDIMMLRPTSVSENSSRGNTAYGESGSYYSPNAEATSGLPDLRGDVARLMLQHLMRWGNTSYFYGTSGVIESRAVLLQWMENDPVDTWEMGRNDAVQRITGVRNVFVDYPELAFILLGESVPSNYTTPSSSGIVSSSTYNNTYNTSSYEPVTYSSIQPNQQAAPVPGTDEGDVMIGNSIIDDRTLSASVVATSATREAETVATRGTYTSADLIYVNVNNTYEDWWDDDYGGNGTPKYALYFYGNNGDAWAELALVEGTTYRASIPAGSWNNVILVRFNPGVYTTPSWSYTSEVDYQQSYDVPMSSYSASGNNRLISWNKGGQGDPAYAQWDHYTEPTTSSDLPTSGAVLIDGFTEAISNNNDVLDYLEKYGAKNCLIVPVNGAVVFYLSGGGDGTEVAIGASALNGTATVMKVYQIDSVDGNTVTGTVRLNQVLATSTEMYYGIGGITWTGDKSNVLMVRNEGSAPMLITNLRASASDAEGQISTRSIHAGNSLDNLEMTIDPDTIAAGLAAVHAMNDGTFGGNETPIIPIDTPVAVLTSASLSLEGLIGVNFYVNVPSTMISNGYYFTVNGEKATLVNVSGMQYKVTGRVAAKEMNDAVELKLFDRNGKQTQFGLVTKTNLTDSYSYSVAEYLAYIEENAGSYAKLMPLTKAMNAYGSYAQTYFKYKTGAAVDADTAAVIDAITIGDNEYTYSYTDDTAHIVYYGESVVTESETAIRFYFTLSGNIGDYTVTVNGEPGSFVKAGKYYFVAVSNIAAKDLGKGNTVTVTYGGETLTIDGYSVYTYVKKQLNSSDANLVKAVKALKYYGDCAATYFAD